MNIKITKQTDSQFQEDEKRPAKLILTVKRGSQPHYYLIIINHPNRNPEGQLPELYAQEHLADSFDHALNIGNHLINNDFSHIETKFEEIKYIPAGKRGKMKLDKKEADVVTVITTATLLSQPQQPIKEVMPEEKSQNKKTAKKPLKSLTKKVKEKKVVSKVKKTPQKKETVKKTVKKVKKNTKSVSKRNKKSI